MKASTINRINELVLSYISIRGLSEDGMKEDNPMVIYFIAVILTRNFNVPRQLFYSIVEEATNMYKKIDNIVENQNPLVKEYLTAMHNSEFDYDSYISEIVDKYKSTLFKLLKLYKTKNVWFNRIKIDMFQNKMWEYAENEDYDKAAELRERISNLELVIEQTQNEENEIDEQNEEGEV